ncbi:MAG: LysE family translocator [Rhizobiaceae bacterium]
MAIAGTSMNSGRTHGLALASGVMTGSLVWSISAAFGLGAIMLANSWLFEIVRYFGACYLLYLAYKSARSAFAPTPPRASTTVVKSLRSAYSKGLMLHLTNPKAILFFGSLYSIGMPANTTAEALIYVITALGIQSLLLFHGYALLFSSKKVTAGYAKLRRWFETVFALAFGAASVKILTTPLE